MLNDLHFILGQQRTAVSHKQVRVSEVDVPLDVTFDVARGHVVVEVGTEFDD